MAYGGDPSAVIRALDGQCHWIAGNCERQLAAGEAQCDCGFVSGSVCDRLAEAWYSHASAVLTAEEKARLGRCPRMLCFTNAGRRCAVVHGGVSDISRFLWPVSPLREFEREIALLGQACGPVDIVFAGHAGVPFQRHLGDVLWVNAGIIGVPPNDGGTLTRFAVLKDGQVRIERLASDAEGAAAAIRAAGLPDDYARTLVSGMWPSEEILPAEMRSWSITASR